MNSALYVGQVRHRRFAPREHAFTMPLFMVWLDLDEAPGLFGRTAGCAWRGPAPVRFHRRDYLDPDHGDLAAAVRRHLAGNGIAAPGPVRMLTHLRYFGHCFNPVTFYFAHDGDHRPVAVLSQITNTPWNERHTYVVPFAGGKARADFAKAFHISPFNGMDQTYAWRFTAPGAGLTVHMENREAGHTVFDATLTLRRRPWSARALHGLLLRFPAETIQVLANIYFQALRLHLKGVAYHPHPASSANQEVPA